MNRSEISSAGIIVNFRFIDAEISNMKKTVFYCSTAFNNETLHILHCNWILLFLFHLPIIIKGHFHWIVRVLCQIRGNRRRYLVKSFEFHHWLNVVDKLDVRSDKRCQRRTQRKGEAPVKLPHTISKFN